MNAKSLAFLSAVSAALMLAACESTPSEHYPLTYQIPIGSSQVTSAYGPQNLTVNGVQNVPVHPGMPLYYQAVSPINLTFYVIDKTGPGNQGPVLAQVQGTMANGSITPTANDVEFVFSASQLNTGGAVQFTISDRPIPSAAPVTLPGTAAPRPAAAPAFPAASVSVTPQ